MIVPMPATVRINVNHAEMTHLLRSPAGPVGRMVGRVERRTVQVARIIAPKDSGRLARDIHGEQEPFSPRGYVAHVGNSPEVYWAWFQHQGTRAHGPKRARAMRFKPKGESHYVFATWVRGVEADPYLVTALRLASPWPVRVLSRRRR